VTKTIYSRYELEGRLRLASMWMPSRRRPAVTLTFDIQNIIRSPVGATEYSLYVSSRLFKRFVRYRGNKICPDGRTDERGGGRTARKHNAFADIVG